MSKLNINEILPDYEDHINEISAIANAGFVLIFNYKFGKGFEFLEHTYPDIWYQQYVDGNYAFFDPTVIFASATIDTPRWSDLKIRAADILGIFHKAKEHGLNYGATTGHRGLDGISFLSVARNDREVSDVEIQIIEEKLKMMCNFLNNRN